MENKDQEYTIDQLRELVLDATGLKKITPTIDNQIRQARIGGASYKDIGRAIYYHFVILKKQIPEVDLLRFGIHSPLAYINQAKEYYEKEAQLAAQKPKDDEPEIKPEIVYYKPTMYKPKDKTINLDEL